MGLWYFRQKEQDTHRTTILGHMNLERRVFDLFEFIIVGTRITLLSSKNAVNKGCVRGEEYVLPHVTDVFAMHRVVRREVLEFIRPGGIKRWIILDESCQEFLEFLVMHKTKIQFVNVVKDV